MTEIQMIDRQGVAPFLEQEMPQQMKEALDADGLLLWGAFENGGMTAVAGMQPDGEITVLYVTPAKERRGTGLQLLNVMRDYAIAVLQLQRVTIEVTPVTRAPYFYKRGFAIALTETAPAGSVAPRKQTVPQYGCAATGGDASSRRCGLRKEAGKCKGSPYRDGCDPCGRFSGDLRRDDLSSCSRKSIYHTGL